MKPITLAIDGRTVSVSAGASILEAADKLGIKIPRLCFHPDLEPFGSCRLCLVEDEKTGRMMASCVTPAAPEMAIRTDTPRIVRHRRNIVRLMIAEHPESCIVCSKGNRCQLRQIAAKLGVGEVKLDSMPNPKALEQANPFIVRDLSKCILCGKCIRADHELVGVGAIDYNLRGFKSRPATIHEKGLEESSCTFCGTCLSMCPTGALSPKSTHFVGTPDRESLTICGFCGVGCSLRMGVFGQTIVEANPSHRPDSVNGATLCVRGHFAEDHLNSADRILEPMRRDAGGLAPATWDAALGEVAERLLTIRKTYGPQSIGFLGSGKCTNEENYLFQKMARTVFRTNNIDTSGRFLGQPEWARLEHRLDGRPRSRPLSQIERADAVLVIGADICRSAPVASYLVKRAVKKGIPLLLADPLRTELAPLASIWLPLSPGSDAELINGLAALLYRGGGHSSDFIHAHTSGFDSYREGLDEIDPDRVGRTTGLDRGILERSAALLSGKKIAFLIGGGVLQHPNARQTLDALINLSLLTGGEGAGLYLLASENNQVGAWDMGASPDLLPGRKALSNETARKAWEHAWEAKISPDHGLDASRMIEEIEKGNLKALYILGENPVRSFPQPARVRAALESLEFLVVQDALSTETAALAHVVLAAAPFSEKAGSFTNLEGRIQAFEPVVSPRGESRPDWEILGRVAEKAGAPGPLITLEGVREEIRRLVPAYRSMPGPGEAGWVEAASAADRIAFVPIEALRERQREAAYPFTAILAGSRFHLGSGTRTSRSERINALNLPGHIQMSVQDAGRMGIADGSRIRISSHWGSIEETMRRSPELGPGLVCVPRALNGNRAMMLVGLQPAGDAFTGWKTVPVNIEPVIKS